MIAREFICDHCGQNFQPMRVNKTGARYCTNRCRRAAFKERWRGERATPAPAFSVDPDALVRLLTDLGVRPWMIDVVEGPSRRLGVVEDRVHELIRTRNRLSEQLRQADAREAVALKECAELRARCKALEPPPRSIRLYG